MAKNKVIAGDYAGSPVATVFGQAYISLGWKNEKYLSKAYVENYEVITEESRKSAKSAVGRAFVGSVLLGGVGLLAGLSAKSKGTYTIAIQFKDGKQSLIEVDDKIYKAIVNGCF